MGHHKTYKHGHIGNAEREEIEEGVGNISEEILAKIFPNLMKNIVRIQKNQQIPSRINPEIHI